MFNDLYADLPAASDGGEAAPRSAFSGGAFSAAPQLQPIARKAPMVVAPPLSVLRPHAAKPSAPRPRAVAAAAPHAALSRPDVPSLAAEATDEYAPALPNSYDDVLRSRALRRKQEELEEKRRALERHKQELEARRSLAASEATHSETLPPPPPYPPPPPPPQREPSPPREAPAAAPVGTSAAQRMMERMGWREGQGLGKSGEGMVTPLVLRKTDRMTGVIVNAPAAPRAPRAAEATHVLCLRGMVGPGEVDELLEDEVAEECEKWGGVVRVLIFEVTQPSCPPADAVRIFVQFTRPEAAAKARAEMDGRFFGGRTVKANFFAEARLEAMQLAPEPGEFE